MTGSMGTSMAAFWALTGYVQYYHDRPENSGSLPLFAVCI